MAVTRHLPAVAAYGWLRAFEQAKGVRIGASDRALSPVRLNQQIGFGGEPRAQWRDDGAGSPELLWSDFGLLAPHGPLPDRLTELVLHAPDGRMVAAFLDLLVQRQAQLHYRAWAQLRPECEAGYEEDRFRLLLTRLAGGAFVVPHLAWHPPSPDVLPALVRQKLGLRLRVRRHAIRWYANPRGARLGNARLGHGIAGRRVAVHAGPDAAIRLRLYPEDVGQMAALRDRDGALVGRLMVLARECHGPDADVELQIVAPADLPSLRLNHTSLGLARLNRTARKDGVR